MKIKSTVCVMTCIPLRDIPDSTETSSAMVVLDDPPSTSTATTSHQSDYAAANDDVSASYRYEKVISCYLLLISALFECQRNFSAF